MHRPVADKSIPRLRIKKGLILDSLPANYSLNLPKLTRRKLRTRHMLSLMRRAIAARLTLVLTAVNGLCCAFWYILQLLWGYVTYVLLLRI